MEVSIFVSSIVPPSSHNDSGRIQHYTDNLGRGTYRCTQDYDYNCSGKLILTTEKVRVRQVRLAVHVEHDYGHPSHDHEGNADSDDEPGPQRKSSIH